MRKSLFVAVSVLALSLFAFAQPVNAMSIRAGQDILIKDEKIEGTLVLTGNNLDITSPIDGDLICVGQNIKIEADVSGDVICAGQSITITGDVGGSVRVAGQLLTLDGAVDRNVTSVGQTLTCTKNCVVSGEFSSWAQDIQIDGSVMGGIYGGAKTLSVSGEVDKGIYVTVKDMNIGSNANVTGDVVYTSEKEAQIADRAVSGKVEHRSEPVKPRMAKTQEPKKEQAFKWVVDVTKSILFKAVFGAILLALFPLFVSKSLEKMNKEFWPSVGWGLIATLVSGVGLVFLVMTLVGIPFAVLGGFAFLILAYVSRLLAAIMLGNKLLSVKEASSQARGYLPMLVGVIALSVATHLPVFGWIVSLLAMWLGLGAIVRAFIYKR